VHQQTLTIGPFEKTYEVDEVSPKVAVGGVAGHMCLQPGEVQDDSIITTQDNLDILNNIILNSIMLNFMKLVLSLIFSRENNSAITI
jgi:hypothetical protein